MTRLGTTVTMRSKLVAHQGFRKLCWTIASGRSNSLKDMIGIKTNRKMTTANGLSADLIFATQGCFFNIRHRELQSHGVALFIGSESTVKKPHGFGSLNMVG